MGSKTIHEDIYTLILSQVTFRLRVKVDDYGPTYFPEAEWNGHIAPARMLRRDTRFESITFVEPPAWLQARLDEEYWIYEPARKARRGRYSEPAQPAELYVYFHWVGVLEPIQNWARNHCFLGEKTTVKRWKNRRGLFEVVCYKFHEGTYLEVSLYDKERGAYQEPERLPGSQERLEQIANAMAQVAGAKEQRVKPALQQATTSNIIRGIFE